MGGQQPQFLSIRNCADKNVAEVTRWGLAIITTLLGTAWPLGGVLDPVFPPN